MFRPLALLSTAALAAAAIGSAHAAEVQLTVTNPVVEMDIVEEIESTPDVATVGTGVTSRAPTAKEAMAANAKAMSALVAKIKALGVDAKDIQTSGINLNAQYAYNQNQPPKFTGYEASNRVQLKVRDLARVGEMLDAFVAAGATNIDGPNFALDDDKAAKAEARQRGFARAKVEAEAYARAAGFSGVRLLSIGESIVGRGPVPVMARAKAFDAVETQSSPVEPGQVSTAINLSVKFEMTR